MSTSRKATTRFHDKQKIIWTYKNQQKKKKKKKKKIK